MNANESFDGIRALTLTEVDEVSGGAKNIDNPLVKIFLKAAQGHKDGVHIALTWSQRELAKLTARQNIPAVEANGAAHIITLPVKPLSWNRLLRFHAQKQIVANDGIQLSRKRVADQCCPIAG